jgi:hypothetical protein
MVLSVVNFDKVVRIFRLIQVLGVVTGSTFVKVTILHVVWIIPLFRSLNLLDLFL